MNISNNNRTSFEIFTATVMKTEVLRDMSPCWYVNSYRPPREF